MGSNYLIVLVDEEENTTEYSGKANNLSSVNELQVFDKSPKRNTCIKSDEWLREGKQNLEEDSKVISCEQLSNLNPLNGLLMKTSSVAHDELASKAQHEQQLNVQQLFDETPKRIGVDVTGHESVVHVTGVLDHKLQNNPYSQISQKAMLTHRNLLTSLESAVEHVKVMCKEKISEQEALFDCKELFSLNRNRVGMIEKSIRMDKEEQNLNIQQVFEELPKENVVKKLFAQQEIDEYCAQLDHMMTSKELEKYDSLDELRKRNEFNFSHWLFDEINQPRKEPSCLHFVLDWKWDPSPKLKLVEVDWCFLFADNHREKWDRSFCFIGFDPGGMQSLCKWLPTDLHTIYNLEGASVIFD